MAHPLDGIGLTCDRARDHLDTLAREFDAFERDAYRIRHDVERFGREHVYRVKALRKTRPEWGPVIGDCLRNAASALDHLAYRLAILHTGTLPPDLARDTHFPICASPQEFWDNLQKLRGIGAELVAPLERLQPYYGRYGADYDSLMILKGLSNFDKHRTLQTSAYGFGGSYEYSPDSLVETVFPEGRLELGAELARFKFDSPDPAIDMEPRFVVRIAFRDTPLGDGVEVWTMLNRICTRVEMIVDQFRPLFNEFA